MDYPFHSSLFIQQHLKKGLWVRDGVLVPHIS
jgi:hypothetical protein